MNNATPRTISPLIIMSLIMTALGSILGAAWAKWQLVMCSFVSLCFALDLWWKRRGNQRDDDV